MNVIQPIRFMQQAAFLLALGIGATMAIFIVMSAVLLRPLHFSGAAMLLAALGIHGVLSCSVADRTRRMSRVVRLAALGLVAVCAAAFPLTHVLQELTLGVRTVALIAAVALVTWIVFMPARRVSRINPS